MAITTFMSKYLPQSDTHTHIKLLTFIFELCKEFESVVLNYSEGITIDRYHILFPAEMFKF